MEKNLLKVTFELEQSDLTDELKAAEEDKYEISDEIKEVKLSSDSLEPVGFIEPVSAAVTITVAYLIKRLVDFWLKDKERGVQIDVRTVPPTVSRIAGIPAGFLVLIDKNGEVIAKKADYENNADLVELVSNTLRIK